ncbi:MAG: TonB family protein [Candidatus Gastranaerophilales bacterium]|nr:TonB family protein [Candidatus Gastranaerophilales bacterium]
MTQLRSKFDFEDTDEPTKGGLKTLPNSFDDSKDEVSFAKSLIISLILHPLCVFLIWLTILALTLLGLVIPRADRPDWKKKDLEFVIVTNEADPIDKNTKYRSDRNSRAGGKHDPTKRVSEPSPAPSPAQVPSPAPAPAPKQPVQKPAPAPKTVQKLTQKPVQTQAPQVQKPVQKPAPQPAKPTAPVQRPVYKPTAEPPRPSMPKLATAPKSPFSVAVPKTEAPVGPRPSAGSGTSTGTLAQGGGSSRGTGTGMPSPQLSPSRGSGSSGSGTTSGTGRPGTRGTGYGTGSMGNPGPGNPSGPPGIDAIKSPDWGPYMRELERRIKRNWNPPKGDASKRVVVLFKIGRDGRLLSIRVSKSSGSISNDDAAKAAIELTAPFKPLPPEFKGSNIDIEFTFDYNVLGASYR